MNDTEWVLIMSTANNPCISLQFLSNFYLTCNIYKLTGNSKYICLQIVIAGKLGAGKSTLTVFSSFSMYMVYWWILQTYRIFQISLQIVIAEKLGAGKFTLTVCSFINAQGVLMNITNLQKIPIADRNSGETRCWKAYPDCSFLVV